MGGDDAGEQEVEIGRIGGGLFRRPNGVVLGASRLDRMGGVLARQRDDIRYNPQRRVTFVQEEWRFEGAPIGWVFKDVFRARVTRSPQERGSSSNKLVCLV
eukprot:2187684-Pleurochrysis_carterae.AAC.1